jgi:ribosomal protein S18 acetylase RimI-like enzyme
MLNHACYHKLSILNNGKKVNIRFLKKQDRDDLITFFHQTPQEDLQFCKEDVKNAKTVDSWLAPENSHRTITLVAQDMETKLPVAFLNLYCGQKATMNVGEIQQILVIRPLQGQGLGSRMLDELITLAAQKQLCWLKVEVVADMKPIIMAFQSRNFDVRAIFEDYLKDAQGKMHDVALMMRPMQKTAVDF